MAIVDRVSKFYVESDPRIGTHIALRWKGRVRYTIPRELSGHEACWRVFNPGRLGIPLRAMARWPRLFGATMCVESDELATIRAAIGDPAGNSYCRSGAEGVWSKDTILFLDHRTSEPLCIVKAGVGEAVGALLKNEASWLSSLRDEPSLADQIPELIAHGSGKDFCFVAQSAMAGKLNLRLGEPHFEFLRKLQQASIRSQHYQDSQLCLNLKSRMNDLRGQLTDAWSIRLETAIQQIRRTLSGAPVSMVAAHNDFTPWNIRLKQDRAFVFDWEYAANEQLPLFDPLHFALLPMALKVEPTAKMAQKVRKTVEECRIWLRKEFCQHEQTQVLAYLTNICVLYLWGARLQPGPHRVLYSYAELIDQVL